MGETLARNMYSKLKKINKNKFCCILLVADIIVLEMHGHTNISNIRICYQLLQNVSNLVYRSKTLS